MNIIGGSAFEAMALEMEARAIKAEARVAALEALCAEVGDSGILSDPRRWLVIRERLRSAGRGEGDVGAIAPESLGRIDNQQEGTGQ